MKTTSPHWNIANGICEKHNVPQIPCPSCMSGDGDEDVEFVVEAIDLDVLDGDNAIGIQTTLNDLVPANFKSPKFLQGSN